MSEACVMRLDARLLGTFELRLDGNPLAVGQPRLQSLLAYLLLHHDAPVQRQRVAYRFWPDQRESAARNNLRAALHKLRQVLPQTPALLDITATTIGWRGAVEIGLDVDRFRAALDEAAGATAASEAIVARGRALATYGGPLLPACYDEWIAEPRDGLATLYADALGRQAQELEASRAYADAILILQRLVRLAPWEEFNYRSLMRLFALNGRRNDALRIFQECVDNLAEELGVTPSAETVALYERLLMGENILPPVADAAAAGSMLIGREAEWRELCTLWHEAGKRAHVVVVRGEAGIGKTALVDELRVWVARQGYRTMGARCFAVEGSLAYAPIIGWLRDAQPPMEPERLLPAHRGLIAQLLPEWADRAGPSPLFPSTDETQRRRLLFEAFAHALVDRAEPALLLLDDIQWCDDDTLEWLQFLLRYRSDAPLLLVLTLRAGDMALNDGLRAWRLEVQRRYPFSELTLDRLGEADTLALARARLQDPLSAEQGATLVRMTDGNPLFVVESLRRIAERPEESAFQIPEAVQAVIGSRLRSLSPPAQALVDQAAVIGRPFAESLLLAATDLAASEAMPALEELWERRILCDLPDGHFDFSHALIGEAAYDALNPVRRRMLHRRAGEALLANVEISEQAIDGEAAHHFELANSLDRAILLYGRAAAEAAAVFALRRAERLYGHAIRLAGRSNLSGDRLATLYLGRGRVLEHLGEHRAAVAIYQELGSLARLRHDSGLECLAIERQATCYAEPTVVHSWSTARPLLERGAMLAAELNDGDLQVRFLRAQMVGASHYGSDEAGRRAGEEAIRIARAIGNEEQLAYLANDLAIHLHLSGDPDAGLPLAQEARRLFQQQGNLAMLADSLSQQALIALHHLDLAVAEASAARCEALCRRIDNGWNLSLVLLTRATLSAMRGDLGAALQSYQESMSVGERAGLALSATMVPAQLGALLRDIGAVEEARAAHETAYAAARRIAPFLAGGIAAQLAMDAFAAGDAAAGNEWLAAATERAPVGAIGRGWLMLADLAWAHLRRAEAFGEWPDALLAVDAALAEARRRKLPLYRPRLLLAQGACLLEMQERERAEVVLNEALALARTHQLRRLEWRILARLVRCQAGRGRANKAAQFNREAAQRVEKLAATLPTSELQEQYRSLPNVRKVLDPL